MGKRIRSQGDTSYTFESCPDYKKIKLMEITKSSREIWMNHNTVVDGIPYYRNEYLTYDTNGILVEHKLNWTIGDPKGKEPPVQPSGPLDYVKKETPKSLEKKFKSLRNK